MNSHLTFNPYAVPEKEKKHYQREEQDNNVRSDY